IYTAENITGTIGANQTVQGTGLVEGRSGGTIANNGVLRATINPKNPSAGLWLRGNHDGSGGGLYLADGGNLYLSNTLSLHGGIFDNTGTGIIDMISNGTATLSDVMNLGEIGIRGLGLVIAVAGPLTNNGIITINSDNNISYAYLRFDASTEINGAGTIHLQPGLLTDINNAQIRGNNGLVGTIGPGQTLTGSGILQGELNIEGTLDPSSSLRRFNIDILHLSPTSQLVVDLGGTSDGEFDRLLLNNTDSIDLDGSLTVNLDAGYTPVFGDVWNIIEGGTISGTFQTKNLPPPPLGMAYRVIEEIDRVFLVFTCRADLSGDTIVNFFDVSLFLTFFYNQDLRADMNDDGVLNFFDVSAFLAAYSQGCP
ncbi:MAG: GC-type dockerin domain-anchored protein, partial [Phycisphaerales bacterium]